MKYSETKKLSAVQDYCAGQDLSNDQINAEGESSLHRERIFKELGALVQANKALQGVNDAR